MKGVYKTDVTRAETNKNFLHGSLSSSTNPIFPFCMLITLLVENWQITLMKFRNNSCNVSQKGGRFFCVRHFNVSGHLPGVFFQFGQRPMMSVSLRKVADFCHRHFNVTVVTCPVSICERICINHPPHHNLILTGYMAHKRIFKKLRHIFLPSECRLSRII